MNLRRGVSRVLIGAGMTGVLLAATPGVLAPSAWADAPATFESFQVGAMAPVMQFTEDFPTATFHPQAEGEYNYTLATLDPSRGYGLADLVWPGGAAANAGALVALLGGPSQVAGLGDPVRAEATSGTSQTSQNVSTPTGTTMSATVVPAKPGQQSADAQSQTAGGGLGPVGSVGQSTSSSSVILDPATNTLTATAQTDAGNISMAGGVVTIGSVTSLAKGVSKNAGNPAVSGATTIQDMKVAGQAAYVDGSGVHAGTPGHPAPGVIDAVVNTALKNIGMSVYTTDPHTIPIGGVQYYVSGSVLFFWAPPQDPNMDSFTLSVGGAAVSMGVTAGTPFVPPAATTTSPSGPAGPNVPAGSLAAALGPQPSSTNLSLPSSSEGASISSGVGRGTSTRSLGTLSGASLPGGLGWGFWALVILGGLAGALALPLVPGVFHKTAAAACPRERRP